LPEEWKEATIALVYKKGDKRVCSNHRGVSLLSPTFNVISNMLLSRLTDCAENIIEDHKCDFRRNRSSTNPIFYICQILEKKW